VTSIPTKLSLKRDSHLDITWDDGTVSVYPIGYLRKNCPCAMCRDSREKQSKSRLHVMQNHVEGPLSVVKAEPVGNYALRLEWSDNHGSGIFSFVYLRQIASAHK
jgi:DUF971 family protein